MINSSIPTGRSLVVRVRGARLWRMKPDLRATRLACNRRGEAPGGWPALLRHPRVFRALRPYRPAGKMVRSSRSARPHPAWLRLPGASLLQPDRDGPV